QVAVQGKVICGAGFWPARPAITMQARCLGYEPVPDPSPECERRVRKSPAPALGARISPAHSRTLT
ncbi:MAG: hypothetical protein ACYTFA_04265, partial [Planctomycetota bacterium]